MDDIPFFSGAISNMSFKWFQYEHLFGFIPCWIHPPIGREKEPYVPCTIARFRTSAAILLGIMGAMYRPFSKLGRSAATPCWANKRNARGNLL